MKSLAPCSKGGGGRRLIQIVLAAAAVYFFTARPARGQFLQEDRRRDPALELFNQASVGSIAISPKGEVVAGASTGLYALEKGAWRRLADGKIGKALAGGDGALYYSQGDRLLVLKNGKPEPLLTHDLGEIADFAAGSRGLFLVSGPRVPHHVSAHRTDPLPPRKNLRAYQRAGKAAPLPAGLDDLYVFSLAFEEKSGFWLAARQGLFRWRTGDEPVRIAPPGEELWLLGETMDGITAFPDQTVWYGNDLGIIQFDARTSAWTGMRPDTHGTPMVSVQAIARDAQGDLWIGGPIGAARLAKDGQWAYYQGPAWLPNDHVLSIACHPDGRVFLGTAAGLGVIEHRSMTLAEKARHFDELAEKHHTNRYGFVWSVYCREPGKIETAGESGYTDNDGLWTASTIASQSLRYAVTKDEAARRSARRSMEGLLLLERVTGIRGYPARSCARADQVAERPELAEWFRAPDGKHVYKGDTSSDEAVGHYFAHALYWDHAATEEEKPSLKKHMADLTDHILEHDFTFVQRADGEPTRWGIWNPERCWKWGYYWYSSGLWSLCILSHLKTAHHITGDARYQEAYLKLIREHDYARRTMNQKVTIRGIENHSDDQMALFSYYPLLRYEEDPSLRATYLESLKRSWREERPERSPAWNFVYNVFLKNREDMKESLDHLRDMPWMLYDWPHDNSRRRDLQLKPLLAGRVEAARGFSMKEFGPYTFTDNPYPLRSGGRGAEVLSPSIYLLPYWLSRFHGLIGPDD
ncbi:MAG: hypothetical protein HY717_00075 [Planctomycetes bacterium]|nr:hypothetical protein [Planctomycetota bacterium]